MALAGAALGIPVGAVAAGASLDRVSATISNLYLLERIESLTVDPQVVVLAGLVAVAAALAGAAPQVFAEASRAPVTLLAPGRASLSPGRRRFWPPRPAGRRDDADRNCGVGGSRSRELARTRGQRVRGRRRAARRRRASPGRGDPAGGGIPGRAELRRGPGNPRGPPRARLYGTAGGGAGRGGRHAGRGEFPDRELPGNPRYLAWGNAGCGHLRLASRGSGWGALDRVRAPGALRRGAGNHGRGSRRSGARSAAGPAGPARRAAGRRAGGGRGPSCRRRPLLHSGRSGGGAGRLRSGGTPGVRAARAAAGSRGRGRTVASRRDPGPSAPGRRGLPRLRQRTGGAVP